MHFKKINTLLGWLVFAFAAFIYLSTIEPSVSFWDCGEFIACAHKLEIGHQPGAPFFLLLGRLFSLFAGNNTEQVAKMVNSLSALAAAFTIMFLFWTITHLTRKILIKDNLYTVYNIVAVLSAGLAGALVCTFSDTFWFSAVEGEVYATSSLFTALAFWLILKWEENADEKSNYRWIILIAYLMGLSIGVHLLNLLTIPALVLVYYFRKYPVTRKGLLTAILLSFVLLYMVVFILIPGLIKLAAWFDLLFVNGFGLLFNAGSVFYLALLGLFFAFLLKFSHKRQKILLNKMLLVLIVFCTGYSSYIVLAIRADANPPINLSRVKDPFSLLGYINREQYVIRPIIYGPYYNAPVTGYKPRYTYVPSDNKYLKTEINARPQYDKKFMTLFPRMSSTDPQDIEAYKRWGEIKGIRIKLQHYDGKKDTVVKPTFAENVRFFMRYQLGYMYFRYFMWNFAGRQTENQGTGGILNGNWISGIPFIDEWRLGPLDNYPKSLMDNKGRNVYYGIPLLLGLIGMVYQFSKNRKDFTAVLLFFLLTGIAIVIYLNEIPITPRERDYAVGGSFYVFCIWIGLGTAGLIDYLNRKLFKWIAVAVVFSSCVIFVPALVAKENFDDHDRSRRYVARDFARNYLNSCAPNAILFTNADNDTYPLWYAQEVEGIRRDVRVVLAPFLNSDWYIQQLADWHYDAAPVPLTIDTKKYTSGRVNHVPYYKRTDQYANLKDVIEFIASDDPRAMVRTTEDTRINYYPTNLVIIETDSVNPELFGGPDKQSVETPVPSLGFKLNSGYLWKNNLVMLDILATNNWERPVYFLSAQVPRELGLLEYMRLDGFAYRLVPYKHEPEGYADIGSIRADEMYDKLMNRFTWGNMNDPDVFMDYNSVRTTSVIGIRNCFSRLAEECIRQGNPEMAIRALDRCMELMPHEIIPFDIFILPIITAYHNAGATEKSSHYAKQYKSILQKEMAYYQSLNSKQAKSVDYEMRYAAYVLQELELYLNPESRIN